MKILIELPTWLGDTVMATPAIENLLRAYPEAEVTFVGSFAAVEVLRHHPNAIRYVIDRSRKKRFRLAGIHELARELGPHDLALSFRSHMASRLLLWLSGSKRRHLYRKEGSGHQVERYNRFVSSITRSNVSPGALRLWFAPYRYERPTMGINPGATYGSAKRWYPEKFAEVARSYASTHDIVIFGGPGETDMAHDIQVRLEGITLTNLAGKTTIEELCRRIAGLSILVSNDSGPMHVAAAYRVPTVAIFGPTRHLETSPWQHPKSVIVRHDIECAPCMKRECPLGHHDCMKNITPQEVIQAIDSLNS